MKRDFYEILGISKGASKAEIKAAYRKMAMASHPDQNKAPDAEEKFKEINEAYEVLSNDQKKTAYDQFGHAAFDPSAGGGGFGGHTYSQQNGPFNFTWTSAGQNPYGNQNADFDFGGFSNPFDIFEQFFGGSYSGQRQQRQPTYKIQLTFLEAANGVEKKVDIEGKSKTIKIPAGVDDGQRIRFNDFILYIDVAQSDVFKREGNDVFVATPVTFTQAALGADIEVPTLESPLKVRIKPGTQPNTLIRLQGKGIKDVNGFGRGDLYIRILIEVPSRLTAHQREILKELGL